MNATIILDDERLATAKALTGEEDSSVLVDQALRSLVEREGERRKAEYRKAIEGIIALGGTEPDVVAPPRRRFE